jgi:CBS domain-containing protein
MNTQLVSSMDAITRSRLQVVRADALLCDVASLLCGTHISLLVVCDRTQSMVGIVTKTDIVQQLGRGDGWSGRRRASDVMVREVVWCLRHDSLAGVLKVMADRGVVHVPVVDGDAKPLGVVNARDALRTLLLDEQYEETLLRNYVMGVGYQ